MCQCQAPSSSQIVSLSLSSNTGKTQKPFSKMNPPKNPFTISNSPIFQTNLNKLYSQREAYAPPVESRQNFDGACGAIGSVVEWLERRDCDRHDLGSKPSRAIPLCPWERHFTALSPAWWPWQAAVN